MTGLLIRMLQRFGICKAFNTTFTLRLAGKRVRVPFVHGMALAGADELWMYDLLQRLLKVVDGAFVDVGVNMGQTLVLVKGIDPTRDYVGFEPNPYCVAYVLDLIRLNRFEQCNLVPAALHCEDAVLSLDLYHPYSADGTASVVSGFRPERNVERKICVPAVRYASAARGLAITTCIGVVKIDVEGAELDVLIGLQEVVKRDRPVLLLEVLPVYTAENVGRMRRQEDVEELMRGWGYSLFRIMKEGRRFAGADRVERIGIHGDLTRCDYVSVPCEKLDILDRLVIS
jgi:FkbM family methyltransferase